MLNRHLYALMGALKAMRTNPWAVLSNTLILGISIGFCLALAGAAKWLAAGDSRSAHIHAYLEFSPNAAVSDQQAFRESIARNPLVEHVAVHNVAAELAALATQLQLESANLANALGPLPQTLVVRIGPMGKRVRPASQVDALIGDWRASPHLERVSVYANDPSTNTGNNRRYAHVLLIVSALIAVSVALMASNMVRNQILRQNLENQIAKYCGADPAFLRRPFLYWGMLQTLLGAVTGLIIFQLARLALQSQGVAVTSLTIISAEATPLVAMRESALALVVGALLGLGCAWITSKFHLRGDTVE